MVRAPWGRTTWLAPLLLFAAVVLVAGLAFNLAHLDTGGETIPSVPAPTSSQAPQGPFSSTSVTSFALMFVFILIGAFVLALFIARRRKGVPRGKELSLWDVVGSFAGLGLFLLLIFLWPRVATNPSANNTTAPPPGGQLVWGGTGTVVGGLPAGLFLGVSVLAALLVIAFFVRANVSMRGRAAARPSKPRRPSPEAAAAVEEAIEELRLGLDVRQAILACFRRFLALLGQRGISSQTTLTPREIEGLAIDRLQVPVEAAEALTSLFEEARYSIHDLGEADRQRAIRSLEGIRAALER